MLKEKRKESGLSQRKLSEKSGIPLRTIQNWEGGGIKCAVVGTLKKVADVLGCRVDDLL